MMRVKSVVDETPEAKDCDKEQHFPVKDCFNIDLAFLSSRNNQSLSLCFKICFLRLNADYMSNFGKSFLQSPLMDG